MDRACPCSAIVMLAVLACSGCGSKSPSAALPTAPPNVVSAERVAKEQRGSAQRALLSWWRAVQFRDADSALGLTDARAIRLVGGVRAFRAAVRDVGDSLPGVVISESVRVGRRRSVLRALIEFYDKRGKAGGGAPLSFSMSRNKRGWRLRDVRYLRDQAIAIRKARARAAR
jgi:hypothetical protein